MKLLPSSSVSEQISSAPTLLLKQSAAYNEVVLSPPLAAEAHPYLQAGVGQVTPAKNLNVIVMSWDK